MDISEYLNKIEVPVFQNINGTILKPKENSSKIAEFYSTIKFLLNLTFSFTAAPIFEPIKCL